MLDEALEEVLNDYFEHSSTMDEEQLYHRLFTIFPVPEDITVDALIEIGEDRDKMKSALRDGGLRAYEHKTQNLGPVMPLAEKRVLLSAIDSQWQRHLTDLDVLREGIGLVSIAQRDPLVEYKRESFNMFDEMEARIRTQAINSIFRVQISQAQAIPARRNLQLGRANVPAVMPATAGATQASTAGRAPEKAQPVRALKRPGPNEPCHCGSGKKYKQCHMREDQKLGR
jgi:preprotein translocase subunit SecA